MISLIGLYNVCIVEIKKICIYDFSNVGCHQENMHIYDFSSHVGGHLGIVITIYLFEH